MSQNVHNTIHVILINVSTNVAEVYIKDHDNALACMVRSQPFIKSNIMVVQIL